MNQLPRLGILLLLISAPLAGVEAQGSEAGTKLDLSLPHQAPPGSFRAAQDLEGMDLDLSLAYGAPAGSLRAAQDLDLSYKSRPIGRRKKWQLDTGKIPFEEGPGPSRVADEGEATGYIGFRLRRPLGKSR